MCRGGEACGRGKEQAHSLLGEGMHGVAGEFLIGNKSPFPLYRPFWSPKHILVYYPLNPPNNPGR